MGDIKVAIKKSTEHKKGLPINSYELVYDSAEAHLESIYFWLLDMLNKFSQEVQKVTDNFTSSPGSGHFAEMGQRATKMQDEAGKYMGGLNQVTKSILNLLYDLKEFEIRLGHYEDAKSKDLKRKENGKLAIKQIWMDNVDIKKGRGSINQMSFELGFVTLRDAFMIANKPADAEKMAKGDNALINDQVKRILIPRLSEFEKWTEASESELRKRFAIEKAYLRQQYETLKLYSAWIRPYLKAAGELKMKGFDNNPALVNAFNTSMFELVLFGKSKISKPPAGISERLMKKKVERDYYSCYLISLKFRGFPQKVTQQHYGFGGRIEMGFDSFALNSEELRVMDDELKNQDIEDVFNFVEETTQDTLKQLEDDIKKFMSDDKKEEREKKEENIDDINPFSALLGFFKQESSKDKNNKKIIKDIKDIKKDNYIEKLLRKEAEAGSNKIIYLIYDIYKKAHGMASSPKDIDGL